MANERYKIYESFWGYGNPNTTKLLFLGIEFGGISPTIAENIDKEIQMSHDFSCEDGPYLPKQLWIDRIQPPKTTEQKQMALSLKIQNRKYDQKYHSDIHGFCSSYEFQSNIFPIPCNSVDSKEWPLIATVFGLPKNKWEYYDSCLDGRLEVLKELLLRIRSKAGDPLIIVMGKLIWSNNSIWERVNSILFESRKFEFEDRVGPSRSTFGYAGNVWLTYHPRNPKFSKIIERLLAKTHQAGKA